MYNNINNCMKEISLINVFRKLWYEHVFWTRMFIISTVSELKDLQLVTQRLLQNPVDFEKVLNKFYGPAKSKRFENLLKEHLLIAADLVNAAKAGNTQLVNSTRIKWYKNADEIAEFLSSINKFWSKGQWQRMLYDHLKMTENEAVYRLTSQYANDIENFDNIQNQAIKMADYMAEGIINEFV